MALLCLVRFARSSLERVHQLAPKALGSTRIKYSMRLSLATGVAVKAKLCFFYQSDFYRRNVLISCQLAI